jgi:Haem-binding domain/Cytochrome P460
MKKTIGTLLLGIVIVFGLLQLIRPSIPDKASSAEIQASPEVRQVLENSCYSCHSDQSRLSWFDEIQPGYWLVRHDVLTAREHLNFSTLGSKPAAAQKAALYESVNMIQLGAMPLPRYARLHPEAKVTREELAVLKNYLAPWSALPSLPSSPSTEHAPATANSTAATSPSIVLGAVQAELNGLAFDPNFKNWKILSTTDRGDNNTFRFVLGNEIAVDAARMGHVSPWPDGTRFAKIAWQKELGEDGLVHPGKFVQVELMVKDSQRYKDTDGWGWGRWRGLDLKPYGQNARFVNECTVCHMPVRGNDYVYTLPITAASVREDVVNNAAAQLPASLPYQPLTWHPISLSTDPVDHTTSILFGNDVALNTPTAAAYPAGTVLALVSWTERDDPHWFGARIPDLPVSVEFVRVSPEGKQIYQDFQGPQWSESKLQPDVVARRLRFVTDLPAAQLP